MAPQDKIEEIPTMSAAEYVVEVFKRTYRAGDAGQWERADAVRDAVEREQEGRAPARPDSGQNDGSQRIIEQFVVALHREGSAEDLMVGTLAKYRTVAIAWPEEDRFKQASFEAHTELAPKAFDKNRVKIMRRLLDRSSRGFVSRNDVRTYKSEMKPKVSTPWEERFRQAIWSIAFTKDIRPQAASEYDTAIQLLEEAIVELRKKAGL